MERVGIVHRGVIHDRGDGGIRIRLPCIAAVHGGGLLGNQRGNGLRDLLRRFDLQALRRGRMAENEIRS